MLFLRWLDSSSGLWLDFVPSESLARSDWLSSNVELLCQGVGQEIPNSVPEYSVDQSASANDIQM